jgi:hypothetical protein
MPKNRPELTAERLRYLLDYDPITGGFTRKVRHCSSVSVGEVAGYNGGHGYMMIGIDGRKYKSHRLAWLYMHGRWPANEIDHINGIRSDNRIENLREATNAENRQNQKVPKNSTSGHIGVNFDKRYGKWRARIKKARKEFSLGYFSSIEDAIAARAKAKAKMHTFQPTDRKEIKKEEPRHDQ